MTKEEGSTDIEQQLHKPLQIQKTEAKFQLDTADISMLHCIEI